MRHIHFSLVIAIFLFTSTDVLAQCPPAIPYPAEPDAQAACNKPELNGICRVEKVCKINKPPAPPNNAFACIKIPVPLVESPAEHPPPCVTPSTTPTPTPTPSITPTPTPTPSPRPRSDGPSTGVSSGDPHIRTFDNVYYDCQGHGEFILARSSSNPQFQLQVRYVRAPGGRVSLGHGFVLQHEGTQTLQVTVKRKAASRATSYSGCELVSYVGGRARRLPNTRTTQTITLAGGTTMMLTAIPSRGVSILVKSPSGMTISARFTRIGAPFGCYMNIFLTIPGSIKATGDIDGLFGVPNGNVADDWTGKDGTIFPIAADRRGQEAYDYCVQNWCIRNEVESLFKYERSDSFAENDKCGDRITPHPPVRNPPPAVLALCGKDPDCLLDATVEGPEIAAAGLEFQMAVSKAAAEDAELKIMSPAIQNGIPVILKFVFDLSAEIPTRLTGVTKFVGYRLDDAGSRTAFRFDLLDDGLPSSSDMTAGDQIYANQVPILVEDAGVRLTFEVYPMFGTTISFDSPLRSKSEGVVSTFSKMSGLAAPAVDEITAKMNSLANRELFVTFLWRNDQDDLDSSVEFEGDIGGFSCFGFGEYVKFSGDNTSPNGKEEYNVLLNAARADRAWSTSTTVILKAGWHGKVYPGPITMNLVIRDLDTKEPVAGTSMTMAVVPGKQSRCTTHVVARLSVEVESDIMLTLKREDEMTMSPAP